jgi:formylglycine-generating enzyme
VTLVLREKSLRWILLASAATVLALCTGAALIAAEKSIADGAAIAFGSVTTRDAELIWLPATETQIGDYNAPRDERPQFTLKIDAFLLDRTPVTVAQFRAFVSETGYVTDAERIGTASVMFHGVGTWAEIEGANWRLPQGSDAPPSIDNHPVTQVSWNDASAFCRAYNARLPTEFEWERAARLGQTPDGTVFRASTRASLDARLRINTWQGIFPVLDEGSDGYTGTSPVGAFGEAPSGLTDMAGNVWEWTSSSYLPYPAPKTENRKPAPERVQRGGSFLCSQDVCEGFRASARSHATPDTALMHVGFRCAAGPQVEPRAGRIRKP